MALPTQDFGAHPGSERIFSSGCGASGFRSWLSSKESICVAGDMGDAGSIPGSGRSPGGGHGNPLLFLPGISHGRGSLAGCSPGRHKELDKTDVTEHAWSSC